MMPRRVITTIAAKYLSKYILSKKTIYAGIKASMILPSQLKEALKVHTHTTYTTIIKSLGDPVSMTGLNSIRAAYTGRFIVIPKPIDLSKFSSSGDKELSEVSVIEGALRNFYCFMEDLLDEVENKDLKEAVETIRYRLHEVFDEETLKDFIEEYIHSRIFRKTSTQLLVDILSWKERFLEMYIAEKIHRQVKEFPRTPEKAELGEPDTIKRYFSEILEKIAGAVDDNVLEAFKEYVAVLFFQAHLYPRILIPFIEVPTWLTMEKIGLMNSEEIAERFDESIYFPSQEDLNGAEEIYDELRERTDIDEVIKIVKMTLSPPLNDLVKTINNAIIEKNIYQIRNYFMERFHKISSGRDEKVLHHTDLTPWSLAKAFYVKGSKDFIDVIVDIFIRDKEIFESFYLRKLSRRYEDLGVIMSFTTNAEDSERIPILFIDKWSMSCKEDSGKSSSSSKPYIGKESGREVYTMEHLVGSVPRAMRTYFLLRESMRSRGTDKTLSLFIGALIGKPLYLDSEKLRTCIENTKDFKYKGLENHVEVNPEDVADILAGTSFMLACLGKDFYFVFGPHGIYPY
ncbi:MAG: hypothetical protein QW689_07025 [Nitrososphaerota archaeon]